MSPTIMETLEDGSKRGWLGVPCTRCKGCGEVYLDWKDADGSCPDCAGTGEGYGLIEPAPDKAAPDQQSSLPSLDYLRGYQDARQAVWQSISTAPNGGRVWVLGGRYVLPELIEADGDWWRHLATKEQGGIKLWAPCEPPLLPEGYKP